MRRERERERRIWELLPVLAAALWLAVASAGPVLAGGDPPPPARTGEMATDCESLELFGGTFLRGNCRTSDSNTNRAWQSVNLYYKIGREHPNQVNVNLVWGGSGFTDRLHGSVGCIDLGLDIDTTTNKVDLTARCMNYRRSRVNVSLALKDRIGVNSSGHFYYK